MASKRTPEGRLATLTVQAKDCYDPADYVLVHVNAIPDRSGVCRWSQDFDGINNTACGNAWVLDDGTPPENGMKYCPYCGKALEWRMLDEDSDDEEESPEPQPCKQE